jgi:hypothetical protein
MGFFDLYIQMVNICAVFLCNKNYFEKFTYTLNQLLTVGNYNGDICLVIGDDLKNDKLLESAILKDNNIIIKHFPDNVFDKEFMDLQQSLNRAPHWIKKLFQYHKLYLFDTYFKQWDYIFYLDCGITIYDDITPMIEQIKENTLLAHSDAYPTYKWKLNIQFDNEQTGYFEKLDSTYNLNRDYFQTTIMLYDTSIIEHDTLANLRRLLSTYPISKTNDQGIIALYFTCIKPVFEQIKIGDEHTFYYDYLRRNNQKYIMLKIN